MPFRELGLGEGDGAALGFDVETTTTVDDLEVDVDDDVDVDVDVDRVNALLDCPQSMMIELVDNTKKNSLNCIVFTCWQN